MPEGFEGAMTMPMNGFQGEADETDLEQHWTNSVPCNSCMWQCGTVFDKCVVLAFVILCHFFSRPPVLIVSILPSALALIQVLSYLIPYEIQLSIGLASHGACWRHLCRHVFTNAWSSGIRKLIVTVVRIDSNLPGTLDWKKLEETCKCRCFLPFGQFRQHKD